MGQRSLLPCWLLPLAVSGHGHLTVPDSRNGGTSAMGGDCSSGACLWFTNNVKIPGPPTLPHAYRTVQLNVTGAADVFKMSPWRAPGTAPVLGSGCGVAGGASEFYNNGGNAPPGYPQGLDALKLPRARNPTWVKGSTARVAWGISANHGGGYSFRLCKADGNVTEECFQRTPLKFAADDLNQSVIQFEHNGKLIPRTVVSEGTFPPGSEWAVNPVPGCYVCDARTTCGEPLPPIPGHRNSSWSEQSECYANCDGLTTSKDTGSCPLGTTQFSEPLNGISGFGANGVGRGVFGWSLSDEVVVPTNIPAGDYVLSWRWDCEESFQVWQNCANVEVVEPSPPPAPSPG